MPLAAVEQQTVLEFAGLAGQWSGALAVCGLLAAGLLVFRLYSREARVGAGPRLRNVLACMRCGVLLLLALVFLNPVMATYLVRSTRAVVAVLIDDSASMAVRDVLEDANNGTDSASTPPRAAQVAELLGKSDAEWLRRLAERNDLLLLTFSDRVRRWSAPWEALAPTTVATTQPDADEEDDRAAHSLREWLAAPIASGAHTNLGRALEAALRIAADQPLAAIVLLSDGAFNRGQSAEDLAALARRARAPLLAAGVGDEREPVNVRLTALLAPASVPKGDPLELRATLLCGGAAAGEVELELTVAANGAEERRVSTRRISLPEPGQSVDVRFALDATQAGEFAYRLRVQPLANEAALDDNERSVRVVVLDQRLRVLIVAGRPTYDYRAVVRLLERDRTMDISCWLQSADATSIREGTTPIRELPHKPEELFAYDAILLMDPDPREMDGSWAVNVRRFVDEFGGGLLLQAGSSYTARFLREPRLAELTGILPVAPDSDAEMRLAEAGSYRNRAAPLLVNDALLAHPLLALAGDTAASRAVWSGMNQVWWNFPVERSKPVATVLLRLGGRGEERDAPALLAVQPFGAGRVAFLGFDHTWRWRSTAERYFDRFWVQMVRYISQARREGASQRGTIVLDQEQITLGDAVRIEARVLDESFAPWHEPQVSAQVPTPTGDIREITLNAIPLREGWFAGRTRLDVAGSIAIRVPLPTSGASTAPSRQEALVRHVQVQRSDAELQALALQRAPLEQLAQLTGGRYVPLAQAAALPDWIESASQTETIEGPRRELWDRTWLLALIGGLLATEWTLRRRNHLL